MAKTLILPVSVSGAVTLNSGGTAAITSAAVDTLQNGVKYRHATIILLTGTVATSGELSVFKVQSSATSAGSYADVSGADAGANALDEDADDSYAIIDVDLNAAGANRFLKVVASSDAAANCPIVHVTCILSDPEKGPYAAADISTIASLTTA